MKIHRERAEPWPRQSLTQMLITRCGGQVSGLALHNSLSSPQTTARRSPEPYLELRGMKWGLEHHSDTNSYEMTDRSQSDFNYLIPSTLQGGSTLSPLLASALLL